MSGIVHPPKLERKMTNLKRSAHGCLMAACLAGQCWGAAYLPMIGPGPLRFQPAPSVQAGASELPLEALAAARVANTSTNDTAPPVPSGLPDKIHHEEPIVTTVSSVIASPEPQTEGESIVDQLLPPLFPTENDLITPQMMLYFFRRQPEPTATPVIGIASPLTFIPPVSAPLRSQSSYTTP